MRIITHILRFPPGARVTLTNRRLYCALFPVLLVLSSFICVAGWADGIYRMDFERWAYAAYRLTVDSWSVFGIPVQSSSSLYHLMRSHITSIPPAPYCSCLSHRPSFRMSTAVAILSSNIVIAVSTRFRSDLPVVFQFDP
jgi:hypothetical protein